MSNGRTGTSQPDRNERPSSLWWIIERRRVEKNGAWETLATVFGESRANWLADAFARRDEEISNG